MELQNSEWEGSVGERVQEKGSNKEDGKQRAVVN